MNEENAAGWAKFEAFVFSGKKQPFDVDMAQDSNSQSNANRMLNTVQTTCKERPVNEVVSIEN